jgi:nickel/cobalt transporter (NicO) family protein
MRKLAVLLALVAALAAPAAALAHPLGNFTINRFSRVQTADHHVYVKYVLDLAEIPTVQAGGADTVAYAARIGRGAHLTVEGRPARLIAVASTLVHPRGAGGLRTTRVEVVLRGPPVDRPVKVAYTDANYAGRIGWKEIVVGADAPSRSHELRGYPKDLLSSPLDETSVTATLSPSSDPPPTAGRTASSPSHADSGFANLIGRGHLSLLVVLASFGAALFWGAAHALSPGHGKAIVTAYLVGARGTARHALLLGGIVTVTHTIGVFGLGIVTLALSQFVVPDRLYPWLNLIAGLLVVGVGASVLYRRSRRRSRHHHHHHHHPELDRRSLLAVGISGGLLPCPSALVVLLAAISLHRIAFGLLLIVAFSLGLAATISGIGLAAVLAKRAFSRLGFDGRLMQLLPAASALFILAAGVAMTLRALPDVS